MKFFVAGACALLCLAAPAWAGAQSLCASDRQPAPARLIERFINADCGDCWTDPATPQPDPSSVALDWIVPGASGGSAPLSAVATGDAGVRLEALKTPIPQRSMTSWHRVKARGGATLRVAHGLPVADYVGVSIKYTELTRVPPAASGRRLTFWLALVEALPAGTEGAPVARNLVKNLHFGIWNGRSQLSKYERNRFYDTRAMTIAAGVNPSRLRLVGWVEDEQGVVLAAAESRCDSR